MYYWITKLFYYYLTMGPEYQLYLYSLQLGVKAFLYYQSRKPPKTILIYERSNRKEREQNETEEDFLILDQNEI